MSSLIRARRQLRRRIRDHVSADRYSHLFVTLVLIFNTLLIIYTLIAVTFWMTMSGVGLLDSLPLALYLLPLLIFLPLMIRGFYKERTAASNFMFLLICAGFFALLSLLVRGLIIALAFNLVAMVLLFITGRFRPKGSIRGAGKKGLVYVLLLNLLGLTFPVSVVILGQVPIDAVTVTTPADLVLEVPLATFDFPYTNITPDTALISTLVADRFAVDLRVLTSDASSWTRLGLWLDALNDTALNYSVTLSTDRDAMAGADPDLLGTTSLLENIYEEHNASLTSLRFALDSRNMTRLPDTVLLDMTLSRNEWETLMSRTRNVDLIGFSELMRASLYSIDLAAIETSASSVKEYGASLGFSMGIMVEAFVLDDMQDSDALTMRLCGQTMNTLDLWERKEVLCGRSRFSYEMRGDVGEYLVMSYSSTLGLLGPEWTMRVGVVGNVTDVDGRPNEVYTDVQGFSDDLTRAAGHGVGLITIESLSSLLITSGSGSVSDLRASVDLHDSVVSTYTFRIYAFRAVFVAVDIFDSIML